MANDRATGAASTLYSRMMAPEATLPQVYTTAAPPYTITYVNSAWERLCGFTAESAVGRTSAILQGERTCKRTLGQVSRVRYRPPFHLPACSRAPEFPRVCMPLKHPRPQRPNSPMPPSTLTLTRSQWQWPQACRSRWC